MFEVEEREDNGIRIKQHYKLKSGKSRYKYIGSWDREDGKALAKCLLEYFGLSALEEEIKTDPTLFVDW